MASFIQTPTFQYNPNASSTEGDAGFSGILGIHVHNARNIHNICIYDNQDVYAKFSLTYNPDDTISTRIIDGGGKNPDFEEDLVMEIRQSDAVLKCEIWMLSRAKNYMEDQLLGFALVPLSSVTGRGKLTQDFNLSSTDLFHSPAGTVKLTLCLNTNLPGNLSGNPSTGSVANSDLISPELVLLDRKASEGGLDEYSRVEFPDINVFKENMKMVSEYFNMSEHDAHLSRSGLIGDCSFLRLGAMHRPLDEYKISANSSDLGIQNSSSLSNDQSLANSIEKNNQMTADIPNSPNASISMESDQIPSACPQIPSSNQELIVSQQEKKPNSSGNEEGSNSEGKNLASGKLGQVFSAPLGSINLEGEQSAMQQQIVDMYMKSMQQFTESLASMKLPMDLDIAGVDNDKGNELIHNHEYNTSELDNKKKASSRVFYGSRAFF